MSSAKMTMIGLYNFDSTLFDDISLPAGINKDVLIPEILRQCGEFEILYPNLEFLKFMISNWSDKHYRTFEKWVQGLAEEFNPLHNYDRHEVYTDTKNGDETIVETKKDNNDISTEDHNVSQSISHTETTSGNTADRNVSAYDAATLQPKEQEVNSGSGAGDGSATNSADNNRREIANNSSNNNSNRKTGETIKHEAHLYGNIGTTKSTEMLLDFLSAERWNIYEHIAELFVDEFCIRIY